MLPSSPCARIEQAELPTHFVARADVGRGPLGTAHTRPRPGNGPGAAQRCLIRAATRARLWNRPTHHQPEYTNGPEHGCRSTGERRHQIGLQPAAHALPRDGVLRNMATPADSVLPVAKGVVRYDWRTDPAGRSANAQSASQDGSQPTPPTAAVPASGTSLTISRRRRRDCIRGRCRERTSGKQQTQERSSELLSGPAADPEDALARIPVCCFLLPGRTVRSIDRPCGRVDPGHLRSFGALQSCHIRGRKAAIELADRGAQDTIKEWSP